MKMSRKKLKSKNSLKVFSIKKKYSDRIFSKDKRFEFRRQNVKVFTGDVCLIYTTSPVKEIGGCFIVKSKIREPIENLWELTKAKRGVSKEEFDEYFEGCEYGTAILLYRVKKFDETFSIHELKQKKFIPPQSYCNLKGPLEPLMKKTLKNVYHDF